MSLRSDARRIAVFAAVAALLPSAALAQRAAAPTILLGGPAALDVSRAARQAMERLQNLRCQQLLDEFSDREGRPLRESLRSTSPDAYLASLVLRNGEIPVGSGHCLSDGAAAFTANGAAIFICGTSFHALGKGAQANALIHEMLHTLGLRENPPSSAEISRQVAARCGG